MSIRSAAFFYGSLMVAAFDVMGPLLGIGYWNWKSDSSL